MLAGTQCMLEYCNLFLIVVQILITVEMANRLFAYLFRINVKLSKKLLCLNRGFNRTILLKDSFLTPF